MNIQDQCCSIAQGKKLKELGVTQASLYYHTSSPNNIVTSEWYLEHIGKVSIKETSLCSAFTVSELGRMLPDYYGSHRGSDIWYCGHIELSDKDWFAFEKTEAMARASMLIYLLENKVTSLNKVNSYHTLVSNPINSN